MPYIQSTYRTSALNHWYTTLLMNEHGTARLFLEVSFDFFFMYVHLSFDFNILFLF